MLLDRENLIYRDGLLAEASRERVQNVPVRYKTSWRVSRIVELGAEQILDHPQHSSLLDDAGVRIVYTSIEIVGSGLTKRQALGLLGENREHSTCIPQK